MASIEFAFNKNDIRKFVLVNRKNKLYIRRYPSKTKKLNTALLNKDLNNLIKRLF